MPKTKVNENKSKDEQIRELKAELKKVRKKAELEKLLAHAYDRFIVSNILLEQCKFHLQDGDRHVRQLLLISS